jgi:small-conductance mechanosensitive channel
MDEVTIATDQANLFQLLDANFLSTGKTALMFIGLVIAAYFVGHVCKRVLRFATRRAYDSDEAYVGSSWDLSAPILQLLIFLLVFTAGAETLGFNFGEYLVGLWPRALAGLIIIAGAVFLSTWINRSLRSYGQRAHAQNKVDDTLITFSASIIRYGVLGIAILMALSQFGFAPGSLIAIVGAAGLAIALALQDTLKAVASGFMLAAFRPFRTGDWVQLDGHEGEVTDINPFTTTINQVDNKQVILTNDKVWGNAIMNYTRQPYRRLDLYYGVHYDTDLNEAMDVLKEIVHAHPKIVRKEDIWVGVHSLDDWAITIRLRAWVGSRVFIPTRADITKSVKEEFDRVGIEIPYPHQVEMVKEGIELKTGFSQAESDVEANP